MKYVLAAVMLLCATLLLGRAPAAADIVCGGSLTGKIAGNIVVPAGAGCLLYQARVSGDVRVMRDATLLVDGREEWTSIGGNVTASDCVSALLDGSVTVDGNLEIHACRSTSGFTGPGIKVRGNFLCQNNQGDCKAVLGEIDGNVETSNNKSGAASDISLTVIGGNLQCEQNTPAPTHSLGGNWVPGQLFGQCGVNSSFAAAPYACGALTGLALPDTTISLAQTYTAGEVILVQHIAGIVKTIVAPVSLCRVAGTINPITNPSRDSDINFEVWLPLTGWTGRYEQPGNGGDAGGIRYLYDVGSLSAAVTNGNAAASTDDGSSKPATAPNGSWALGHPQKINDWAYRAVHRTNLNGRIITAAFYGTPPNYRYFKGCSKGGFEGITAAQRFPEDFDGVMAGDAFSAASGEALTWGWQHINNPTFNPAGVILNSSLPAITNAVQAACAATKTVPTDNFLGDPTQCRLDAQQIFSAILTPQQIANLQAVYAGPANSAGGSLGPGYEPGNEAQVWPGILTQLPVTGPNQVGYFIQEPTFDLLRDFNVDTTPAFFDGFPILPPSPGSVPQTLGSAFNAYAAPDLSAFKARGGKLIQYHGWVDDEAPPLEAVNYFNSIVALEAESDPSGKTGLDETQRYYRLFVAPGMGHCRRGPGLNEFGRNGGSGPASSDMFTALEEWVEQGKAPAQVTAWNCTNQVDVTATTCTLAQGTFNRPLCPYPQKALYVGTGSTRDAANFICQ